MSSSKSGPGRSSGRAPRAGGATATGSLYERYKDALRRGHVAALRGRNEAAVDAYGEAATIAPDRALPHASIGGILAKMDRLDDAVSAYARALTLAPNDEPALRGLADVHIRANRRMDAAGTLDRLAEAMDGAGRLPDATDAARRALELAESRDRRAQVEALVGRLRATPSNDEAAQRALDQALQLLEPAARADHAADGDGALTSGARALATTDAASPAADDGAEADGTDSAPGQSAPASEPEPRPSIDQEPSEVDEPVEVDEPAGLGIALGAAAEAALFAGDIDAAHDGLLAAARAHRRAGRVVAAVDACYLAIGLAPADPELHLLLVELYLDRGWRAQAADKLLLLGRLADLDGDHEVRDRLCALVSERMADEPRVAELCA